MQKISSFCDSTIPAVALKNQKVAELWENSSAFFRNIIASNLKDFGMSEERDRMILGIFVIPALTCLKNGFSEQDIADMPEWKLDYAAEFTGPPEVFEETLQKLNITAETETYKAHEMLAEQKDWLTIVLANKYPDYSIILECLPEWVLTDAEKIDYVQTIHRTCNPVWYLKALQRMTKQQFELIKCCKGNPLIILCLQHQIETNMCVAYKEFDLNLWISVWVGNEFLRFPTYRWEIVSGVLSDIRTNLKFKEMDGTLFVSQNVMPNCLIAGPLFKYNTEDPVKSYCQENLGYLGVSDILLNHLVDTETIHSCIFPALSHVINKRFEYFLYLKYFNYINKVYNCNNNLVIEILSRYSITKLYDNGLSYGMVKIGGCIYSIFVAEIGGLLKEVEQRGESVDVGTCKATHFNLDWHIECINNWLRENPK